MKSYSKSLVIREMKIYNHRKYHYTPVEWLKTDHRKYVEQLELSNIAGRNVKWYHDFGKQLGSFLQS